MRRFYCLLIQEMVHQRCLTCADARTGLNRQHCQISRVYILYKAWNHREVENYNEQPRKIRVSV
ncbi:hypothetical protein M407DRAFT_158574 [Tulasnella calospora MUT 4182]|uniref:Uncharacterized protein n=1 Tax=Tulasnella calospora MUT 4182 TaxID=1051891 RepID=A0A0C3M8V0_9AGAM|nr:hypothetical protein M407DRAFT_158574 [Tulasnella calospora MUT 4182]